MSSASPVILILGAGANIGHHVSRVFAAKGYKTAIAARSLKEEDSTPTQLNIRSDFSDPASIQRVFSKVQSSLGHPHVVVYNAASVTPQDAKNPLSIPLDKFTRDLAINTTSAYAAAQQAVLAFGQLPGTASRTFIYTGNITNESPIFTLMDLGVGKSATAHIIHCAAEGYKEKGYKFYYADERNADGSAVYGDLDGGAHAELFVKLAEGEGQAVWQQTFVKGIGYKKF